MNQKVLLADDSLTIQKVIKITLANQPYDITDCSTEEELFKKLPEVKPRLVFLDFNLSERHTGYDLTAKIKAILPTTKVLLLLGTFDTVDDAAMEKCGASDKIVKPFDSNKFISICRHLIDDTMDGEEIEYPDTEEADEPTLTSDIEDNNWTVSHTVEQNKQFEATPEQTKPQSSMNALAQEISDWGMSVPGVISDDRVHDKVIDLPPVIESKTAPKEEVQEAQVAKPTLPKQPAKLEVVSDSAKFPENEDLDYPTMDEQPEEPKKPTSKLIPLDTFKEDDFAIEHVINSADETDVSSIEAQIRDELEDNLWQVDEFEDLKNDLANKFEEAKSTYKPSLSDFDESLFKPLDEDDKEHELQWNQLTEPSSETSSKSPVDTEELMKILRADMQDMIKKEVQAYMDKLFQQNVEKVTWEVIPDLAENLIRQELSRISKQVLNDQN